MSGDAQGDLQRVLSKRKGVLDLLLETAYTKPALVDELEVSRSTIDRAIDELLAINCIERTEPGASQYHGTSLGELMQQTHDTYLDRLRDLENAESILAELPRDAPMSDAFLKNAEVYSSVRSPDIAFRPAQNLLPESSRMIGTAPVVYREYFEQLIGRVEDGEFELELVIETEVLETIHNHYSDEFETLSGFDSVHLYETDESVHYGLWLMDLPSSPTAGITFYNDDGVPGTIINGSPDAVDWATNQYNQIKQLSTTIH